MKLYIRNNSHRMKSIKIISSVSEDVIYKKKFTIIAGVNGVGKSTFVKHLKTTHSELGHIIDPDALAKEHGGNLKGGKEALKDINRKIVALGEKLNKLVGPLFSFLGYFPQVQLLLSIPQFGQNIEFDIKNILVSII